MTTELATRQTPLVFSVRFCDDCGKQLDLAQAFHDSGSTFGEIRDLWASAPMFVCDRCFDRWFSSKCKHECRNRPCEHGGDCWVDSSPWAYCTFFAPPREGSRRGAAKRKRRQPRVCQWCETPGLFEHTKLRQVETMREDDPASRRFIWICQECLKSLLAHARERTEV
ncbi:MAG TPA: hypothetical protein VM492_13515 [Sumerlaeia bacterium]|nr:hypothetical protein [Sumerlaeia bacterium]